MDPYDFVQLAILAVGGEIKGKTKLQKTMYFLGVLTGHLDDLGYRPHFYGPYSEEVVDAVDRLEAVGFLDQSIRGGGTVDTSGFEIYRCDYRLNKDGLAIAQAKSKKNAKLWRELQRAAGILKRAGNIDYMKLSVAAKAYFMLGQKKGQASMTELATLAKRFGWNVTPQQVREAARYLSELDLVELSKN